ncbi:hypothetical protein D9M70_611050 [compost metagenome]
MLERQLVGEDRDEDQVVDAENHLHDDKGDEGDPGGGVLGKQQDILHRRSSFVGGASSRKNRRKYLRNIAEVTSAAAICGGALPFTI